VTSKLPHQFIRGASIGSIGIVLLIAGDARAESLTARGNEPGWQLEITDDAIDFSTMDGVAVSVQRVPPATTANEVAVYSANVEGKPFSLVVVDKICSDTMTGMPFPKTVAVVMEDQNFIGCGGEPLSLLLGDWKVEEIGGRGVIDESEASIAFDPDGSLHGNSSCNRFFGSFALTAEGLTISDTGGTMMACDPGSMDQEQRFLSALEQVRRFEMLPDGRLCLIGEDGHVVVSARKQIPIFDD
jgi:heat shock protein HslJ